MCLIIANKTGKELEEHHLQNGWDSNPHAGGIMVVKDGKLIIDKGYFTFESFYEAYKKYIGLPIVIHFRWKTSGLNDKDNCHPFAFQETEPDEQGNQDILGAFCHNGVLSSFSAKIKDKSDTFAFNEIILKELTKDSGGRQWWKNEGFRGLLEESIGHFNKLVFLDNSGEIVIFNESSGEWMEPDEIWASNGSYHTIKQRYTDTSNYYNQGSTQQHWQRYESDHYMAGRAVAEVKQIPHINLDSEKTTDLFGISDEELVEVDNYLANLNEPVFSEV